MVRSALTPSLITNIILQAQHFVCVFNVIKGDSIIRIIDARYN